MAETSPIRVLHALGSLNRGGIETWLLHVLRHIDRARFRMDFVVHTDVAGAYDDEVRSLGSRIYPCPHPRRPQTYRRKLAAILAEHGPYDILHGHVHHYSGYILRLASRAGVPVRIAHSHNDTSPLQVRAHLLRRGYFALMQRWISRYANLGLAASQKAAASLFGSHWPADPRWELLFYGVDLAPFRDRPSSSRVRAELNIPSGAYVVGHVGRFDYQKNHAFLVDTFAELARRDSRAMLLLVGDGGLRPAIQKQVAQQGLADRVIFAGQRRDVPRLMMGAMDVFLMPSWFEGLPVVLIEAQSAGLPCVISDVIAHEATLVTSLVRRASLSRPAAEWAEEILALRHSDAVASPAEALCQLEQSPHNIHHSVSRLQTVYSGGVARARTMQPAGSTTEQGGAAA